MRISNTKLEAVKDALVELECLPSYDLSEADVACDNLASALVSAFFSRKDNPFLGKAPALHEVLEVLEKRFSLGQDAVEAANKIKELLEDAYTVDDDEEDIGEEVKEWADVVVVEVQKLLES